MSWSVCPRPTNSRPERSSADLDGRAVGEGPVGWVDDDLIELTGQRGFLPGDLGLATLTGPLHERDTTLMTPDRRGPEERVAERVVEVAMGVHDDSHREGVSSRRWAWISRAWRYVLRVSMTSASPSPRTTPMFWSKNS